MWRWRLSKRLIRVINIPDPSQLLTSRCRHFITECLRATKECPPRTYVLHNDHSSCLQMLQSVSIFRHSKYKISSSWCRLLLRCEFLSPYSLTESCAFLSVSRVCSWPDTGLLTAHCWILPEGVGYILYCEWSSRTRRPSVLNPSTTTPAAPPPPPTRVHPATSHDLNSSQNYWIFFFSFTSSSRRRRRKRRRRRRKRSGSSISNRRRRRRSMFL